VLTAALLALHAGPAQAAPDDDVDYDESDFEDEEYDPDADADGDGDNDAVSDEVEDPDEEGPSGSVSAELGGGVKAKGKRGKRKKKAKKAKPTGPWIKRYLPDNHIVEVGGYLGAIIVSDNHGLFDPGIGPQPSLNRSAFDIGFRATYMPLKFLGVGIETGVMPTRSSSEDSRANMWTFRGQIVGQLPMYRITPMMVLGGGFLGVRSGAEILNSGDGTFHWGPGVKMYVNDWIALRVDGRHLVNSTGANGERVHHGEVLVGLDVTLRLRRWIGDGAARNADSDNDFVPDRVDQCPDEYGEDDVGCPKDRDSDKDGVPDKRDRCPKEWGDQPNGCPVKDSDGDSILDPQDSCVDEAENFNGFEDTDGCPDEPPEEVKKLTGVMEGIFFPSGKSAVRNKSRGTLNEVVATLEKYPEIRILITGHTDNTGSRETNMALSAERAEAVKAYLVDKGIDEGRIQTEGMGPDAPVADNATKKGRGENRRIEFKVIP
jgi:outer membrane protein OmpA-like peptidoglycan-associated protein